MTSLLLAALLASQPADLRDVDAVTRVLASLRAADPAVCELAGQSITNGWGWGWMGNGDDPMPRPMPTPMPTPMPMPFAGRGAGTVMPRTARASSGWDARVVDAFRPALRDNSRCVRRIAARVVGRAHPSWAPQEFAALAKSSEAGFREIGQLGLGVIEDPATMPAMIAGLGDSDETVRGTAAWALGQVESTQAIPALTKALGDSAVSVRRKAA